MKKFRSVWIKICFICLLLGVVFAGAGFCMGAGKYMNNKYQISESNDESTFKETYTDIESLDISLPFTELEIKEGEELSVSGIGIDEKKIKIKNDNGTLKISRESNNFLNIFGIHLDGGLNIGFTDKDSPKVIISVPKGTQFNKVSLEVGAGTLSASELNCDKLDVSVGAGTGVMEGIFVTEDADMEVGAGTLTLKNFTANKLDLECGMGEIVMDGVVEKSCAAECGIGEISMNLKGNTEEYRYSVECGMGEVKINDDDYSGFATETEKGNGEKVLDLECGMGSIKVQIQP